jgi:hypothetical protein
MVDVLPQSTVIFSAEVSWLNYRIAFAVWMVVFFLIPEEDSIKKFAAAEHLISGDFYIPQLILKITSSGQVGYCGFLVWQTTWLNAVKYGLYRHLTDL